ncbi:MAG: hypothetical protein SGBAC_002488 [Bacillariaceae sp.]
MPASVDAKSVGRRKAGRTPVRSTAPRPRSGSTTPQSSPSTSQRKRIPSIDTQDDGETSQRSSKRSTRSKSRKEGKVRRSHSMNNSPTRPNHGSKSPTPRKLRSRNSTGGTPEELLNASASSIKKEPKDSSKRKTRSGKTRGGKKGGSRGLSPGPAAKLAPDKVPQTVSGRHRRSIGSDSLNNNGSAIRSPGALVGRPMVTNHKAMRTGRRKSAVEYSSSYNPGNSSSAHVRHAQSHSTLLYHSDESEASDIESEDESTIGALQSMSVQDIGALRGTETAQEIDSKWQQHMSRTDNILFSVFPRHIAEALVAGKKVEPENHDLVTIFFSDIVGFTDISSTLDALKISDMLDRLYHSFDALSSYHDVFKVETIGDAYMAVTNLAKKQTDHCKRIAEFSIDAIRVAQKTLIDKDDPSRGYVNIRVGFHSGPVVSNVVGSINPRYCLFGDTVNTASRMESNSAKNLIHCSDASAQLLQEQAPGIRIYPRGAINVKGKGSMNTFWVHKEGEKESVSTAKSFFKAIRGRK